MMIIIIFKNLFLIIILKVKKNLHFMKKKLNGLKIIYLNNLNKKKLKKRIKKIKMYLYV